MSRLRQIAPAAGAVALLALAWQVASWIVGASGDSGASLVPGWDHVLSKDLPSFAAFDGAGSLGVRRDLGDALSVLLDHTIVTLERVLAGLAIGAVAGSVVGVLVGTNATLRQIADLPVRLLRNIPLLALVPLFLVWFGDRSIGIVVYIAFALATLYLTTAIAAVETVDPTRLAFARTLGAGRRQIYRHVIVPSIVPELLAATRIAVGLAWAVDLGGEYLAAEKGLGHLLLISQQYVSAGRMLIVLILFAVLSTGLTAILGAVGRRATAWVPRERRSTTASRVTHTEAGAVQPA